MALSDSFAIKIFKQRDRILARDAGEIFERSNIDGPIGFMFRGMVQKFFLQTSNCVSMKEEIALNAHQRLVVNQQLQELAGVRPLLACDAGAFHRFVK